RRMGAPKKTMRIGKIRARLDRPAERTDGIGVASLRHPDKAMGKISPRFLGIARDRTISPGFGFREGLLSILPTLKRTPGEADSPQAMGCRIAVIQLGGAGQHVEGVPRSRVRMLAVEEHAAHETLPGVQVSRRLAFQAIVLGSEKLGL